MNYLKTDSSSGSSDDSMEHPPIRMTYALGRTVEERLTFPKPDLRAHLASYRESGNRHPGNRRVTNSGWQFHKLHDPFGWTVKERLTFPKPDLRDLMSDTTTLKQIGGTGGDAFSFAGQNNGAGLEKIGVWVAESQVKAVKVWLTDGRVQMFGGRCPIFKIRGPYEEFTFQPGECFTSLSLWANKEEDRLGAIKFKTSLGRQFFAKMTSQRLVTEYSMDVGSGFCLGVAGRSGWEIDRMGFMFLKAVESTVLTDVKYPTLHQLIPIQVIVEEIKSLTFRNNSSATQKQKVESSKKVIKTSSWSMSKNFTSAFSVKVKAGVPEIAKVTTRCSVSVGSESTYSQEYTDERTETLSTDVDVSPGKKMDVSVTIGRATFDLPYTGTVKMTCKNGSVFEYGTKGTYKGVTYTDIKVDTKESPL